MSKAITVPRLRRAAKRYYERNPVGGSLHIVLDDGNIRRGHIEYCLHHAVDHNDAAGAMLARGLLRASISQRVRLVRRYGDYA